MSDASGKFMPMLVGRLHRALSRASGATPRRTLFRRPTVLTASAREPGFVPSPEQVKAILNALSAGELHLAGTLAFALGMKAGELVALRWSDINMQGAKLRIERFVEQSEVGLSFKGAGFGTAYRELSIPKTVVAELRSHGQQQQRRLLSLGFAPTRGEGLVLSHHDGTLYLPAQLAADWLACLRAQNLPEVALESLRRSHIGWLIASGVDVVTISRRLGDLNPEALLHMYPDLFGNTDDLAAVAIEQLMTSEPRGNDF